MRPLNADTLTLLDAGRAVIRGMVRFDFGTGIYCFWKGSAPFEFEGRTYLPGGVIEVDDIQGSYGSEAVGLTMRLAEAPDDGLTPAVLATIEQEDYHQRPVTISDAYFHPDTNALLLVEPVYRGLVDVIDHESGEQSALVIQCEGRALDNVKPGFRVRSTADQQSIWPGDRFYEHAEVSGKQEIFWGRDKP
ncbi:DUF2163 domain-containing protein [Aurantimonas endophytica]|uniref:DUF2163 domain-containing protein n=1 Tax=Aurantimonas endophytica TaxID=1522175 RepID=A0A7W6HAK6_9HYPH|nr:hypothetical protein [Aurantimonas endophytica]MCO6402763.1 DUF2163 domain-containing protein [Aurantimonas endophytica]